MKKSHTKDPGIINHESSKGYFALIIVLAALLSFSSGLKGRFVWDDEYVILKNLFIRDLKNLPLLLTGEYFQPAEIGHYTRSGEESYRPIVTFTHFLDYKFFGLNPVGYHATSILVHTATALMLFFLLLNMQLKPQGAFVGAIIFAVHPLNSETVNMISYREDLLVGFFSCLALLSFLKNRCLRFCLFMCLALLSKEMALVILPLIIFHEWLFFREQTPRYRCLFAALLLTGLYLSLIFLIFPGQQSVPVSYPGSSVGAGIATMIRVILKYFTLFFFPYPLSVDYNFPYSESIYDPAAGGCLFLLLLILAIPILLKWKKQPAFFLAWFFIALIPVSGIYPIKNFIAERYLYIPIMGLCALAGYGYQLLAQKGKIYQLSARILLLAIIVTGITLNNIRNKIWWDETDFFKAMVKTNPASNKGYSSLGMISYRAGQLPKAEKYLLKSLNLNPNNDIARHNLGCLYQSQKRWDEAEKIFQENIAQNPDFLESRYQLALIFRNKGQISKAQKELKTVLEQNPNFIPAKFVLGSILQEQHEYQAAEKLYKQILKIDPHYEKALKNLGIIYFYFLNMPDKAGEMFSAYLRENPDDPQKDAINQIIQNLKGP